MLNLFENYTERERDLEHSLRVSGHNPITLVLNDDGFLPPHIVSPVGFFTRMDFHKKTSHDKPRFFNDLNLPAYWEIRASGNDGEIFEGYKKKGHINYSKRPGDYRIIQSIEWLNESERIRVVDLYNQNGVLFGKKTYSDGHHVLTSYFDIRGREVLLMNHILETVQLNFNEQQYIFSDYISFILFYLETAQLPTQRILYNNLGRPYFILNALQRFNSEVSYHHILFWQESSQEMPENMKGIFKAQHSATQQIVVQDREEYSRLSQQVPNKARVKLSYLGYLYDFKREPLVAPSLLIHTNSDQIEKIQELVENLPNFKFNISARTEMSQKLMQLEEYSNVSLYPNISTQELEKVIAENSFYLDINHGGELDNVIRQAFEHNLLVFAFTQTQHNMRMMSPAHVFDKEDYKSMIDIMQRFVADPSDYMEALHLQWRDAGQTTEKAYKEVMK
ncbi:accessory Sec system glycosylation chaperone GtfB [Lactococcus petauri]|uniref:accessory Sec system glycosylation chaperone GtfB n=1 Tax=Lactococcus petauri TaxID=1940789 RepID=UPI003854176F